MWLNKISISFFIGLVVISTLSTAGYYTFENITNNNANDATIGEQQLRMELIDRGTDNQGDWQIGLAFSNIGVNASVISEIYLEDTRYLTFDYVNDSHESVDFEDKNKVSPGNLPGGKSITPIFKANPKLSVEANNPEPTNGVGPDQWVELIYTLNGTYSYDDILTALANSDIRVGLHVKSFDSGGSESFINDAGVVPEPATMLFCLVGAGILLNGERKKRLMNNRA